MDPLIPSSIRIAMILEGSRGDIQPYLALALTLQERGNMVSIFGNADHFAFCNKTTNEKITCHPVFYDFGKAFQTKPIIQKALSSGSTIQMAIGLTALQSDRMEQDYETMWRALESYTPTLILTGGIARSKALLYSVCKTIPIIILDVQVLLPVSDKGPVGLPTLPVGHNKLGFKIRLWRSNVEKKKAIAKNILNIKDVDGKFELPILAALLFDLSKFPTPLCWALSKHLVPIHPEWPIEHMKFCGFLTMGKEQELALARNKDSGDNDDDPAKGSSSVFGTTESQQALEVFLNKGPPPVYMGWGSMQCKNPDYMVSLAVEALQLSDQRGILLGGWANLGSKHVPDHLQSYCEENVLFCDSAPHEWLFPQCSCIVHHGGSGTTAASVRSGRPTIVTPIQGDQFSFADIIQASGCGIGLCHLGRLTPKVLAEAIQQCTTDADILQKASDIGKRLQNEDGCANFVEFLDDWIVKEHATGKWLQKHNALLKECQEWHDRKSFISSCNVS